MTEQQGNAPMRFLRSWLEPGGRLLSGHLGRLCESLQNLGSRLREAVASAAGQSAAGIVREVVGNLLHQRDNEQHVSSWPLRQPFRTSSDLWQDPHELEHPSWRDNFDDLPPEEEWNSEPADPVRASAARSGHWLAGLAVGLQTAAWWLLQGPRRFPVLTALGWGLVAALVACGSGALAITGASLLSLLGLVQAGGKVLSFMTIRS